MGHACTVDDRGRERPIASQPRTRATARQTPHPGARAAKEQPGAGRHRARPVRGLLRAGSGLKNRWTRVPLASVVAPSQAEAPRATETRPRTPRRRGALREQRARGREQVRDEELERNDGAAREGRERAALRRPGSAQGRPRRRADACCQQRPAGQRIGGPRRHRGRGDHAPRPVAPQAVDRSAAPPIVNGRTAAGSHPTPAEVHGPRRRREHRGRRRAPRPAGAR